MDPPAVGIKSLSPVLTMLSVVAAAAVGSSAYYLWMSIRANGQFCFPLDDPWIHLQFARNLREFGSFSYFRNEMVTSGSTAPLYTLMLAVGFFFTRNEMILSFVLGILSHGTLAVLTFFLARRLFDDDLPALATAVLVAIEPRLVHASVSGMETSLFMALLVASYLAYLDRRPVALGVLLGCALWTRPEALIFAGVLAADHGIREWHHHRVRPAKQTQRRAPANEPGGTTGLPRHLKIAGGILAACAGAYVLWNLLLSGSILPNTYSAKVRYYSGTSAGFVSEVIAFLSAGSRFPFAVAVLLGSIGAIVSVVQRRNARLGVPLLWTLLLAGAYAVTVPHLYQEGRYMMPVLPFTIVLGVEGVLILARWVGGKIPALAGGLWRRVVIAALLIVPVVQYGQASAGQATTYALVTKYIADRQVKTAMWIAAHLPTDAVVGTHDIGAIGYYSGRKIVDMVGLVSPGMIEHIGKFEGLVRFLGTQHVTHIAVLRNWFEVSSQTPLFQTDEGAPEIMEVFTFSPFKTRFIVQEVSRAMIIAAGLLASGRKNDAAALLDQAAKVEPACARLRFLQGCAAAEQGKSDRAAGLFRETLRLQPDHPQAQAALAELARAADSTQSRKEARP